MAGSGTYTCLGECVPGGGWSGVQGPVVGDGIREPTGETPLGIAEGEWSY